MPWMKLPGTTIDGFGIGGENLPIVDSHYVNVPDELVFVAQDHGLVNDGTTHVDP